MKIKKVLGIVLCAAITVGMFTGCGKSEKADSKLVTVSIWTGSSHDFDVCSKFIGDWNDTVGKEKGVYIDYQLKADDSLSQNLEIALKAGNAPDLFYAGSMKSLAENGHIASVEELPGGDKLIEKFSDVIDDENNRVDGKTYTLPYGTNLRGLIYNKDMFKEAGIVDENGEAKPPVTFDDYRECAKKLTNKDKDKYGVVYPMKWSGWFGGDVTTVVQSSAGHTGYNPVTGEYDYTAYAEIMQYLIDIYKDGSVYPDIEGLDNDTARALFAEGKIGMKISYSFDVGVLNNQFPAKCDWGVAPLPVLDADNCYYQRMTYGMSPFINKKSVETKGEAVAAVFEFLLSDEYVLDMYKSGCSFPLNYDMIKDVELGDDAPKGWSDFAKMLEVSHMFNHEPKTETANLTSIGDRFVEYCWTGKKSTKQVADEYVADLYEAQKLYYKNNPDESPEIYKNPDWNIKR